MMMRRHSLTHPSDHRPLYLYLGATTRVKEQQVVMPYLQLSRQGAAESAPRPLLAGKSGSRLTNENEQKIPTKKTNTKSCFTAAPDHLTAPNENQRSLLFIHSFIHSLIRYLFVGFHYYM
eukprot:GHVU01127703.1.p1 GENE.GHVU01127703.1~~GHVU01127703.1.p1  ORF type:complete len:120 (-),score=5.14 GHVU01127703.1:26-385(-)